MEDCMTLDDIWKDFCEAMGELMLIQHKEKTYSEKFYAMYNSIHDKVKKGERKDIPIGGHCYRFKNIRTNRYIVYKDGNMNAEDSIKFEHFKRNRNYQLYLATAYEIFEDAVVNFYAYLGKYDINFWPLSEYGNIKYDEIQNCTFLFLKERAKHRKNGPIGIFKDLTKKFNCDIEICDLRLTTVIIMISCLRHIIIHNRGYTNNKNEFIQSVAKKLGMSKDGEEIKYLKSTVEEFFGQNEDENMVLLLEMKADSTGYSYYSRFGCLFNILMNAIYIIYEEVQHHIAKIKEENSSI